MPGGLDGGAVNHKLRTFASQIVPPIMIRGARAARSPWTRLGRRGRLRSAGYYDGVYDASSTYRQPYWDSRYYFLWSVIADRLVRSNVENVLDLGCGPGQFAALLRDKGFTKYSGIDFSQKSIEIARQVCPEFEFAVADLSDPNTLSDREYDCVLALEFLEHVVDDVAILDRVDPGTRTVLTVPNFPDPAHVRYFRNAAAVRTRYEHLFSDFRIDTFWPDKSGMRYFLLDGTRANAPKLLSELPGDQLPSVVAEALLLRDGENSVPF
jgi:SAM-dependent methyltransferase